MAFSSAKPTTPEGLRRSGASSFAKATEDKTEDRMAEGNGKEYQRDGGERLEGQMLAFFI